MTSEGHTAEEIVDLIRGQSWKNGGCHIIDRDDAINLVEQYANVVAAERSIEATRAAYDSAITLVDSKARPKAEGGAG